MSDHDAHRPLRVDEDLALIFTWQEDRKISKELTLHYHRGVYLIESSPDALELRGKRCRVHTYADGHIELRYRGRSSPFRAFDEKRDTICEFSRLAVDTTFRRRPGEGASRFGEVSSLDCSQRELRTFSMIAVATVLSAFAISDLIDRPHCFAMMEPFLPRLLRRSGFVVNPAGSAIEYHGVRTPFYLEAGEAVTDMADELKDFYQAILASFARTGQLSSDPGAPAATAVRKDHSASFSWPRFGQSVFAV
jgi:hypothetical protein